MKQASFKGHLQTSMGDIFVRYEPGVGAPMVFLSGLSDSLDSWNEVDYYLEFEGAKLFVDLLGQGQTVCSSENASQGGEASATKDDFDFRKQVTALQEVINQFHFEKIHLTGFSYGGGVALAYAALHPELIAKLILLNPFIIRLDQSFGLQRFWANGFAMTKSLAGPWGAYFNILERQYAKFIHDYMDYRFSLRVPSESERHRAIALAEGIFAFNGFDVVADLPDDSVHLLSVERDTLVPKALYVDFWNKLPESKRCEWVKVRDGEHLLLEQQPLFVAKYLSWVLGHDSSRDLLEGQMNSQAHGGIFIADACAGKMKAC
jgi:pimeloyl-ACP methyl ester carboxylesterase